MIKVVIDKRTEPRIITPDDIQIGGIVLWYGLQADIPSGYILCDGTTSDTVDMRGKFAYGASVDGDLKVTGGTENHSHSGGSTNSTGNHNHSYTGNPTGNCSNNNSAPGGSGFTGADASHSHDIGDGSTGSSGDHSHSMSGISDSQNSMPVHKKIYWIKRTS